MINSHRKQQTSPQTNEWIKDKTDIFLKKLPDLKIPPIQNLIQVDAFRHLVGKRYNPKSAQFLVSPYSSKKQIFNPARMLISLDKAFRQLQSLVANNAKILFVGTTNDLIKQVIQDRALATENYYINKRWLGGTLTNFKTVSHSIKKLNDLINLQGTDGWNKYNKKEQIELTKQIEKLNKFIGGIKTMNLSSSRYAVANSISALVVADYVREHNAVTEAKKLGIPIIALCNTNTCAPDATISIPCNTNNNSTIWLMINFLFDAIANAQGKDTVVYGKENISIPTQEVKIEGTDFIRAKKNVRSL